MITETMVKQSHWIEKGILIQLVKIFIQMLDQVSCQLVRI